MTYTKTTIPTQVWTTHTIPTLIQTISATAIQPTPTVGNLVDAFKPKRAGTKTSHIILVLDDSVSMQQGRAATISGYNEYLDSQKEDAIKSGIPTFFSLYKFGGSGVTCNYSRVDIAEVPHIDMNTYDPRCGSTNLYDGMGSAMMSINSFLTEVKKKHRDSIVITILTDGAENSSRTFGIADVKGMVEKAEAKNWGFMFLGANIDAFAVGSTLGFNQANTMQFNADSAAGTFRSASAMTSRMKGAYALNCTTDDVYATTSFSDAERTAAVTKDE